jgi:hypothetical protein
MKTKLSLGLFLAGAAWNLAAPVPPPDQLLPADTLAVMTVPEYAQACAAYDQNAVSQLWRDPAMKPFKDKFLSKLEQEIVTPLERELGVKLADYRGLIQGQLTFAFIQNGWQGTADPPQPAFLVLADSREKSDQLKAKLAEVRQKWVDAGKPIKTEKVRDIQFTKLIGLGKEASAALERAFPALKEQSEGAQEEGEAEAKTEDKEVGLLVGQSDALLILGNDLKAIEKVLVRQAGGPVPALRDEPAFQADYQARYREAQAFGWANFTPLGNILKRLAEEGDTQAAQQEQASTAPPRAKLLAASGLLGLKALGFRVSEAPDGSFAEFHLDVPAAHRAGLFKMLAAEAKTAAPPPFVPADTVQFQRWRLDVKGAWNNLETMLTEVFPPFGTTLKFVFDSVGKDKDPNFDLRRELFGNLGDDLILYQMKPRGKTLAELSSPPSLFLLGSPNAEKLSAALRSVTGLLPPPLGKLEEREFLGRKIYALGMPAAPSPAGTTPSPPRSLSFASSGSYLAFSTDAAMLESYLRSSENTGKGLIETTGLGEAAQKVGGMNSGLFTYENQAETVRALVDTLKQDTSTLDAFFRVTTEGIQLTPFRAGLPKDESGPAKSLKDWVDFSLLPPFEQIAKYFHFSVGAGSLTPDGMAYRVYSPTPPQLRK